MKPIPEKTIMELTELISSGYFWSIGNVPSEDVNELMWQLNGALAARTVELVPSSLKITEDYTILVKERGNQYA